MTTDRDQSIERLLRRARASDPHAPDAVRSVRLQPDHCPDPETLAALADDKLTAAARREVEAHIADCHRCQALTAAMVRSETSAEAGAHDATIAVPWWKSGALRWLVPAAAAATAVALWVTLPDQRTPVPAQQPTTDTQIAAAPPPVAPEASERDEARQAPADPRANRAAEGGAADGNLQRAAPAAPPPAAPAEAPRKTEESPAFEARSEAVRRQDAPAAVAEGLPPSRDASADRDQPSGVPAAAPVEALIVQSRAAAIFDVVSSNPQIRWRIAPGPIVQYSADGGVTWSVQQTGASTELTAGSAPAPEVCWLVGRGGLVVRTTNGGRQWQRIAFPETVDLTAVTASSALDAVVSLADGRRFRTMDGGRTWAPVRE